MPTEPSNVRRAAAEFWLNVLFWQARHAPILNAIYKPFALWLVWIFSRHVPEIASLNARRIYGPDVSKTQIRRYAQGVLSSFIDFVGDVGRSAVMTDSELRAQIKSVTGEQGYIAARAQGKGAIIATAHMGSFEAAAAGLLQHEKRIHVVFKRDERNLFERVRSDLRRRLGVIEAPIDDGMAIWFHLRDALRRDEIVMVQADRVMPGQKGVSVPFLHGHTMLPTGPIKLALASGAPIIPIIALRNKGGRVAIHIEPPINVEPSSEPIHPALLNLATILETYVRAHPTQWLVLHRAFDEDLPTAPAVEHRA